MWFEILIIAENDNTIKFDVKMTINALVPRAETSLFQNNKVLLILLAFVFGTEELS